MPKNHARGDATGQIAALRNKAQAMSSIPSPEARLIAQLLNETADMMELIIEACVPRPVMVH